MSVVTHGHSGARGDGKRRPSPEFNTWASMRQRCLNPNAMAYPNYGGRGVTICDRWQSFENFLADMGRRPARGPQGDRDRAAPRAV